MRPPHHLIQQWADNDGDTDEWSVDSDYCAMTLAEVFDKSSMVDRVTISFKDGAFVTLRCCYGKDPE